MFLQTLSETDKTNEGCLFSLMYRYEFQALKSYAVVYFLPSSSLAQKQSKVYLIQQKTGDGIHYI